MDELKALAKMILDEATAQGADCAQCIVRETRKEEFNVDGGQFSLMRTLFDREVSVTALRDHRKGVVSVNRFDEPSVREAVRACLQACESAAPDEGWEFAPGPVCEHFTDGAPVCDREALFRRTRELLDDVSARHPRIIMEQMITAHDAARTVYMNTRDVTWTRESGAYSFQLMYSAHEGEKGSSFFSSDVTLAALDRPVIDCGMIERELSAVERQIDTAPLQGKFVGTAVLAPAAFLQIVMSPLLSSFVSDSALIDGSSLWKDKLNQPVADPRLTISFTPRSEDVVLGERFTAEGYRAENFDLIRDGVLVSFRLSQYGANKTGGRRAGCGGWNLSIPSGEATLDELIRGIDRGILVMRFSGGSPSPGGEFSGVAKNSFLIENGRIAGALAETMVSGCVPDMLNRLRAISSDTLRDGTMCVPYLAFDGVTVSGK